MADPKEPKKIEVDESVLTDLMAQLASQKRDIDSLNAKALISDVEEGKKGLREVEDAAAKYAKAPHEYSLRMVSMADTKGNETKKLVIGWTAKGCYVKVKDHPNEPETLMYDVLFYGDEKAVPITAKKFKDGERIKCVEVSRDIKLEKHATGEEMEVTQFDPKHGMTATGIIIDGFDQRPEGTYTLQVPGFPDPITVNMNHVNA